MYTITFQDGEIWRGGNIENSKWNEMPNKIIDKISYTLHKQTIDISGYESYNHLVERTQNILDGKTKITKIFLLAKDGAIVIKFIFDFNIKKWNTEGGIFGQEYYNKPTSGWKKGLKTLFPTTNFPFSNK